MDYRIYHDESKGAGFWHGILFVPEENKAKLVSYLKSARDQSKFDDQISFKDVKKEGKKERLARSWISIGTGALRQKAGKEPYQIFNGSSFGDERYVVMTEVLRCRFIVFRDRDDFRSMTHMPDHAARFETSFRIALKGGLHLFSGESDPIRITGIHFDGHEHHRRRLDHERIVGRLQGLRSHVSISEDCLIDDRTSNHKKPDSQHWDDCQLLQLTDLFIGGVRRCLLPDVALTEEQRRMRRSIYFPIENNLINKYREGAARMKNSRWGGGFCMSQCAIVDGKWNFQTLEYEYGYTEKQLQMSI